MALEVASVSKRLVTSRTLVRFLARVQSGMGLEVALVRKGLPTHLRAAAGKGVNRRLIRPFPARARTAGAGGA